MLKPRLIPCLLLDDQRLVKTNRFENPKYVGDPINTVRIFNEKEVDEIMIIDIGATKKGEDINFELIESISSECFMPLAYGGGIKSEEDAFRLFELGVEKVVLQNAFYNNPNLITKITSRFGQQSVVVSIDIRKNWRSKVRPYIAHKKKTIKNEPIEQLMQKAAELGAGEIILQLVHRDGTKLGADLSSLPSCLKTFELPIIVAGGTSSLEDVKQYLSIGANAVAAGAFFVFQGPYNAVLINYPKYDGLELI